MGNLDFALKSTRQFAVQRLSGMGLLLTLWLLLLPGRLPAQNRFALLIASGEYRPGSTKITSLKAPRNDVRLMASLLRWRYGFPAEQVTLLGVEAEAFPPSTLYRFGGRHAAVNNITREVEELKRKVRPDDYVVVYFSGHGVQQGFDPTSSTLSAENYLLAYDARIRHHAFRDLMRSLPSRHLTLIVDACFSGGLATKAIKDGTFDGASFHVVSKEPDAAPNLPIVEIDVPREKGGAPPHPGTQYLLAACQEKEEAQELRFKAAGQGEAKAISAFTWSLYYTLAHQEQPPSPPLVQRRVTDFLQGLNCKEQHPVFLQTPDTVVIAPFAWTSDRPRFPIVRSASGGMVLEGGYFAGVKPGQMLQFGPFRKFRMRQAVVIRSDWFEADIGQNLTEALEGREWAEVYDPNTVPVGGTAILVGVSQYRFLPNASLPGVENDVARMTRVLRERGFRTVVLLDREATRTAIQQAFEDARASMRPDEMFVYYHSSHGAPDHHLLAYDTTDAGENAISVEDLKAWMGAIPAASRTLVLDACFAGGFQSRTAQPGKNKFYPLRRYRNRGGRDIPQVSMRLKDIYSDSSYAFFGSSQPDEPSLLLNLADKTGSVFTYYFANELEGKERRTWSGVVQPTTSRVVEATAGRQTPAFNARYLTAPIFGRVLDGGVTTMPILINLSELYNVQNEDAAVLQLRCEMSREPDGENRYSPGVQVRMKLKVNRTGYLFIVNRDDEDVAHLCGWREKDLDTSSVDAMLNGSRITAGGGEFPYREGKSGPQTTARDGFERWKAFLFTDEKQAKLFAERWRQLPQDTEEHVRRGSLGQSRLPPDFRMPADALYTAEIQYQVTRQSP